MKSWKCDVCGGEGYPLKPGYKANGVSYTILCTDHLVEFEGPKHGFSSNFCSFCIEK